MFEKSLTDLVKGIRSNKKTESAYITACIKECRDEINQNDMDLKAQAILKLTYLQMFGYQMDWAAFNCIECMSNPFFKSKRIGYLGAIQVRLSAFASGLCLPVRARAPWRPCARASARLRLAGCAVLPACSAGCLSLLWCSCLALTALAFRPSSVLRTGHRRHPALHQPRQEGHGIAERVRGRARAERPRQYCDAGPRP